MRSQVAPDTGSLAVIDGPAGVGKTALAVAFGHEIADQFPDAQLFVDLRGFTPHRAPRSASDALAWCLRSLGVDAAAVPQDADEQAGLYRSLLANKRALVVLDNASSSDQVHPLLPGTSSGLALVTSRNRLPGLAGHEDALSLPLQPMGVEDGVAMLARALGRKQIEAHPDAAQHLVRLCGGLPLALRVIAARVRSRTGLTIRDCLDELNEEEHVLDGLELDGEASSDVRAVFSLSCRDLAHNEAAAFRALAQHPGAEFSLPAASALLEAEPRRAKRTLAKLVDRNLLHEIRPGRYRFHDLLLLYARERGLCEDDAHCREAILRRGFDWYLHTADSAVRHLSPRMHRIPASDRPPKCQPLTFADQRSALEWVEQEEDVLVAAVHRAANEGAHEFVPWIRWCSPGTSCCASRGARGSNRADSPRPMPEPALNPAARRGLI